MKMKRSLLYILLLCCLVCEPVFSANKQKRKDKDEALLVNFMQSAFVGMPDTLFPYISRRNRNYLIEMSKAGGHEYVDNSFGGRSTLYIISNKHIQVKISEEVSFDMLVYEGGYLWLTTICSPKCYSQGTLYTDNWETIRDILPPNDSVFVKAQIENDSLIWVTEPSDIDRL